MKFRMVWRIVTVPRGLRWILEDEDTTSFPMLVAQYQDEDSDEWYDFEIE